MRYQVGVDIFDMQRMAKAIQKDNPIYFESIFTVEERQAAKEHADLCAYFSTRFALKEAAFKALNTYWIEGMEWNQIATSCTGWQAPTVTYVGKMGEVASKIRVNAISASVSSDAGLAFATVIITRM